MFYRRKDICMIYCIDNSEYCTWASVAGGILRACALFLSVEPEKKQNLLKLDEAPLINMIVVNYSGS